MAEVNTYRRGNPPGLNRKIEPIMTSKTAKQPLVFMKLNKYMMEFLFYFVNISDKPASKELIDAVEDFRAYTKGKPDRQILQEIREFSNLPRLSPGKTDAEDMYAMNDYRVPVPNSLINRNLLEYMLAVNNYESAEHFLYRGTGWEDRNINIM